MTTDDEPTLHEPLSTDELRAHKERLLSLLRTLGEKVEREEDEFLLPSGGERGQPDDQPIEDTALDVEAGTLEAADELGYAVHEALDRIGEGTFGLCSSCGERISRERLLLVPYATTCRSCAARTG